MPLWRRAVAEGMAAFALVFAGCRTMAPSSARVSLMGATGVPPHALAALISIA
jgi:hypothetical protein